MQTGTPRPWRARPVADAPVDPLVLRTEDLAKGWLIALLESSALGDAPTIASEEFARDGPRICDAVVRALAHEADLRTLEPGGALEWLAGRVGAMTGSSDPEAALRAVESLRTVLWSAVRQCLVDPDPDEISELAERLALVTEQVRLAVVRSASSSGEGPPGAGNRLRAAPGAVRPGPG
jgi:hypothetical protein